jgi:phosphoribosylanthranilate isomerase
MICNNLQVKICGITNIDDAIFCANNNTDAIGFVFFKNSSRYIDIDTTKSIVSKLPIFIQKVGLFVNHTPEQINDIMEQTKLSIAQIHFEVDDDFLSKIKYQYIQVIRVKDKNDLSKIDKDKYYIVDAFTNKYGGEGVKIDLSVFDNIDCSRFILAGGLTSEYLVNIKKYKFYGVDVSSGVESSKGIKDTNKIKKFIQIAKNITSSN